MKTFITGAYGFVGSEVTQKLKNEYKVYAMTRSEVFMQKVQALGYTLVITVADVIVDPKNRHTK